MLLICVYDGDSAAIKRTYLMEALVVPQQTGMLYSGSNKHQKPSPESATPVAGRATPFLYLQAGLKKSS